MREYLGGIGLGAKILYDEVGPKVHWDHPDNRLILATGPLAGLPVWGTGGLTVVTRGALDRRRHVDAGQWLLRRLPQVLGLRRHRAPGPGQEALVSLHQRRHRGDPGRRASGRQGHVGDAAGARDGARAQRPPHVGLRHRSRGGEPRPVRRDPRRLRARRLQERLRRRHGQEEAQGGVHRPRDEEPEGPRRARARPGRRRHRPRSQDRSLDLHALQLRHAARGLEPLQARRAADQELHDEPHAASTCPTGSRPSCARASTIAAISAAPAACATAISR